MDPFFENYGIVEWTCFLTAASSLFFLLCYYFFDFSRVAFFKTGKEIKNEKQEPVSVIICARNEAEFLKNHLPKILEQDYPDYQVVVVNDCSWDESESILEEMEKAFSRLKVVTIQEMEKYSHGKKFALTLGIKAAMHELLLFTDADCVPAGKDWITTMSRNFISQKQIVLGYGPYLKLPGILNMIIRYDTFHNALQYFSFALAGMPYCGVGRNMSYKKSLFFEKKGFASHQHILSGDDDLFVNENANKINTAIELDTAGYTFSVPKKTFASWITQKKRHLSTARFYKSKHRFTLGFYWSLQGIFYLSLFATLFFGGDWRLFAMLWFVKLLSQFIVFGKAMQKLGESDLVWMMPFWDLIMILIYPTFALQAFFVKQTKWK